ncbi:Ig-like domain-containing protein [Aeromicrobium wangtongii]|uniref:Ig-like domain-containing protein n=1 Tax=Aeromicrobium wangtongii TaxID=2969247 RepID=UPI00201760AB|nr:Ig-like domain-containing protein [Aeromicrobium wangtongii]MCL3817259.1 Ig-like domain-containing protein [Aeromicrobium wangtongii]
MLVPGLLRQCRQLGGSRRQGDRTDQVGGAGLVAGRGGRPLKKGSTTKKVTVTLKNGRATVSLPKLAKGTWKVKVTYLGDANYVQTKTVSITKKLKVKA